MPNLIRAIVLCNFAVCWEYIFRSEIRALAPTAVITKNISYGGKRLRWHKSIGFCLGERQDVLIATIWMWWLYKKNQSIEPSLLSLLYAAISSSSHDPHQTGSYGSDCTEVWSLTWGCEHGWWMYTPFMLKMTFSSQEIWIRDDAQMKLCSDVKEFILHIFLVPNDLMIFFISCVCVCVCSNALKAFGLFYYLSF